MALLALGAIGPAALCLSAAPTAWRWGLGMLAIAEGVRLSRREGARDPLALRFVADGSLRLGSEHAAQRLADVRVRVQGPFAWLAGRAADGRIVRLAWWPDTLDATAARVLRLAAAGTFMPEERARCPSFATMPG